jgi:hypothetical protein
MEKNGCSFLLADQNEKLIDIHNKTTNDILELFKSSCNAKPIPQKDIPILKIPTEYDI